MRAKPRLGDFYEYMSLNIIEFKNLGPNPALQRGTSGTSYNSAVKKKMSKF